MKMMEKVMVAQERMAQRMTEQGMLVKGMQEQGTMGQGMMASVIYTNDHDDHQISSIVRNC